MRCEVASLDNAARHRRHVLKSAQSRETSDAQISDDCLAAMNAGESGLFQIRNQLANLARHMPNSATRQKTMPD